MSITLAIPAEIVGDTETLRQRLCDLERDLVIHAVTQGDLVRDGMGEWILRRRERQFVTYADRWHTFHAELHRRHLGFELAHPKGLA